MDHRFGLDHLCGEDSHDGASRAGLAIQRRAATRRRRVRLVVVFLATRAKELGNFNETDHQVRRSQTGA
jgi:hypothetical protein